MSRRRKRELIDLKENILNILKSRTENLNPKQIAWELNLRGSQYQKKITKAISDLEKSGLIIRKEKYKFRCNQSYQLVVGTIDINKRGDGYVQCGDYNEDIFIKKSNRLNSLNNDTVSVEIIKNSRHVLTGKIEKVLKRGQNKFIGTIDDNGKNIFFIPENDKVGSDFFIPTESLNGAKHKDRVIIQLLDWPVSAGCPFGTVIRVLDNNPSLKAAISSSVEVFGIRNEFSKTIGEELKHISSKIKKSEITKRRDFREDITFTIDPKDAKDFDDALSIKFLPNKKVQIGVHIADVSHYVPVGSEVDNEAFLRAFSVYFPGKVIPMLPEKLSNEICSLRPNEDKLSFSIVFEGREGASELKAVWFGKGIINSDYRFHYDEVEDVLLKKRGGFYKELETLNQIALNFRSKRMENGSIDFCRKEICFQLNNFNEPTHLIEKIPLQAHKLVEEFMLLANKAVANKLNRGIYRVHDLPCADQLEDVARYLKNSGFSVHLNSKKKDLPIRINAILKKPGINVDVFQNLILRAMSKASYSTQNIGHYGLGFAKYMHFTSPIRRYTDLIIHRLLFKHINSEQYHVRGLEKKCAHFSSLEKLYVDVERKINKFVQLKLLENSVGKMFCGTISSIVKWGVYVELKGGRGEGLIPIKQFTEEKYYHNSDLFSLINRKNGHKYMLGDDVSVKIKSINLVKNELDLALVKL